MRLISPVTILSCLGLAPKTKRRFLATIAAAGLAVLALGSRPTAADEPQVVASPATADNADAGNAEMSAKERRREARRRSRDEPIPAAEAARSETDTTDPNAPLVFVVAVQPDMECRRIAVVGSRVPKEVCTPVGQRGADEQEAQDFLRRTRERSTMTVACPPTNPALPGPAAAYCGP